MNAETVRLLLARHGQTEWHHPNRYAGRTDVKLNETGRREAEALARRAAEERPDLVVSSPLSRALETARGAAEACGAELVVEGRLREVDFGDFEGKTMGEIRTLHPLAARRFEEDPAANPFPNGEPAPAAARRATDALQDLRRAHGGSTVLVVAHNTLLRLSLCALLGVPLRDYRRRFPRLLNVALSEVHLAPEGAAVLTLNDASHLRRPGRRARLP